jgi:tetratricopeptide (TPR) repeat protein
MFQDLGNVPDGEGAALHNLGDVYLQMGRLRQALALFEQALVIYRKIQDRYSEVMALESIGTVHACLNQEAQSLKFYQQALEIQQSMDESPSGDNCASRIGEARSLDYIGAIYYKLGNYPLALGYHLRALGILHALHQTSGSMVFLYDTTGSEKFLQNMKSVYTRLGLHSQGAKSYQQALEIIETFGYEANEEAIENYFHLEGDCTTKK